MLGGSSRFDPASSTRSFRIDSPDFAAGLVALAAAGLIGYAGNLAAAGVRVVATVREYVAGLRASILR